MLVLHAFGCAHRESFGEQACSNRAIDYLERAKVRIDAANANDQVRSTKLKTVIGMDLASLYSDGRDMEKAISSHRWFLANCNECNQVIANHLINLGHNFNRFERFEYTIEVLEGFMDTMKTSEEEEIFMHTEEIFGEEMYAEEELIHAYIGCGEFLKAKAADKNRRSTDIHDCLNVAWQSARIEEGLCNSFSETDHGIFFNRHHKVIFLFAYFTTNGIQLRVLYYSITGAIIHLFLLRRPHIEYTLSRINAIFLC